MLSRHSVMIMILGSSIFLESIFLVLFRSQIPDQVVHMSLVLGIVLLVYVMTSVTLSGIKNRMIDGIIVERRMLKKRLHAYDFDYIEVMLTNPTATRFDAVQVNDYYPESFSLVEGSNTCSVTLPPFTTTSFAYVLRANERGSYSMGPTELYVGDETGYTIDFKKYSNQTKIVVYPRIMRHVEKRLKHPSEQQVVGSKHSKRKGKGFDYVGSRKYITGDDLKLIDWKYFAKTSEPGTKEFHVERNVNVVLTMDCSGSMNVTAGRETKMDSCVDGAAYLAYQFLKQSDSVGLLTCGPKRMEFICPGKGDESYHKVFGALAAIEAEEGRADLNKYVNHILKKLDSRTIFFIFTDCSDAASVIKVCKLVREALHEVLLIVPYIELKHYTNILFYTERKKHNPAYVSALAHALFIEDMVQMTTTVEKLRKMDVQVIVTSTDEMNRALVSRLGVAKARAGIKQSAGSQAGGAGG